MPILPLYKPNSDSQKSTDYSYVKEYSLQLICDGKFLQAWVIWEEGTSRKCSHKTGLSTSLWSFVKHDWCGKAQSTGDSATPGMYKKANWESHREQSSKQNSSTAYLHFGYSFQVPVFPHDGLTVCKVQAEIDLFLPTFFFFLS